MGKRYVFRETRMGTKARTLLTLVLLGIIDVVIPLPLTGLLLIYVVIARPPWFAELVQEIYHPD